MLKKFITNRVVLNTIILFIFTFSLECIIRKFTSAPFNDFAVVRIALSSLIMALSWSYIAHFLPKLGGRILNIIYVLFIGIYEFAEFGLYNFIGFFMGVGNTEQGTKVLSYIMDFLKSLKGEYWLLLIPTIIALIYYCVGDYFIMKKHSRNKEFNITQKIYIEVVTFIIIASLCGIYYYTIRSNKFQNELQTESNYSLWLYPENSNLAVNNFGVVVYGFADIKSLVLGIDADIVYNIETEKEKPNKKPPVTDNSRTIDDAAWKMLMDNTSDATKKKLNNYFINREITEKNEYTGVFKDKNLIIVMMESTNEIATLNKDDFPTLSKLYNEGISFRNNFTPRNNCSTGNNEFTSLTSLFTINNTCTANAYASNKYFEAAFNVFNRAGYKTTSYHDYTEQYYRRNKIHTNLGSNKFYGVTDLGIKYDPKYEEWPSDVEMFEKAQKYYMNEDKFMTYFATVSVHQTYYPSSVLGDKYTHLWKDTDYSMSLKRYLSKMKTLDQALETLLKQLESAGKLEDTVIALFADHFPYGLNDSQINSYLKAQNAGYTVNRNSTKNKDVDRTPMILYNAGMEPKIVEEYTSIIDLLPTLLNMFDVEYDPRLYLGTDIFSKSHTSRVVFADGSWQNEYGYYHAPSSKMNYVTDFRYTNEELKNINQEISVRQKMSASAIKSNYFNYLGNGLDKYKKKIEEDKKEQTVVEEKSESEE